MDGSLPAGSETPGGRPVSGLERLRFGDYRRSRLSDLCGVRDIHPDVWGAGHDSGLYSWDYLYRLATEQAQRWQAYLDELHQTGASRDPDVSAIRFIP
jgi:hypothetical protein